MTRTVETGAGRGIPRGLAEHRSAAIRHLRYALHLAIPREPDRPIEGDVGIELDLGRGASCWPPIDFAPDPDDAAAARSIRDVRVNGRTVSFELRDGHLCIESDPPASAGRQRIDILFRAGPAGLRRRRELVHTLFVPAQAHKVFPCFDQPDLKAPLTLELEIPGDWRVLANTPEVSRSREGDLARIRFAATEPLPTYLFAFVTGRFGLRSATIGAREMTMLFPLAATARLDARAGEIFRLHAEALALLEGYTGIAYPFAQFGFALIPDFDFRGMEHPGAVCYRQRCLDLPDEADASERIERAHLIAHETAHMWFGNLVTMRWFDDVWLKEVFANFMADKFLAREFPAADHRLDFLLRHVPAAYAIERTEGTHAIREPLANLAEAAEHYDALTYHKAPVAMAALAHTLGERAMQRGLASYLAAYRYANADWPQLRACLQQQTRADLAAFSEDWIETVTPRALAIGPGRDGESTYGVRALSDRERSGALERLSKGRTPQHRALAWLALYEDMLRGGALPARLLTAAVRLLERETEPALLARLIEDSAEIYWRLLSGRQRAFAAGPVERALRLRAADSSSERWLTTLTRFAVTPETIAELAAIWRGEERQRPALSEPLAIRLAQTIALNRPAQAGEVLGAQLERMQDADRRERLRCLAPAFSTRLAERDAFFERLTAGAVRDPWAVAGLKLLNHPRRATQALHYLEPGLGHAARLRERGDIFLPRQWLCALFAGHASADAAAIIRRHLDESGLPTRLRRLILQTADPVFRAARIRARP